MTILSDNVRIFTHIDKAMKCHVQAEYRLIVEGT